MGGIHIIIYAPFQGITAPMYTLMPTSQNKSDEYQHQRHRTC